MGRCAHRLYDFNIRIMMYPHPLCYYPCTDGFAAGIKYSRFLHKMPVTI